MDRLFDTSAGEQDGPIEKALQLNLVALEVRIIQLNSRR